MPSTTDSATEGVGRYFPSYSRLSPSWNAFQFFNFMCAERVHAQLVICCWCAKSSPFLVADCVVFFLMSFFNTCGQLHDYWWLCVNKLVDFGTGHEAIEMLTEFRLDERQFEPNALDSVPMKLQQRLLCCWKCCLKINSFYCCL